MDMVVISVNGVEVECRVFSLGFVEAFYYFCFNILLKDLPAILCAKDKVVLHHIDAVT